MKNAASTIFDHEKFPVKIMKPEDTIELSNDYLKAKFNDYGFLESISVDGESRELSIQMHK